VPKTVRFEKLNQGAGIYVKIRLFCLAILLGAGALFLIPQKNCTAEKNTVSVSAVVLEEISYRLLDDQITVQTNSPYVARLILGSDAYYGRIISVATKHQTFIEKPIIVSSF
jgi:hypothetical protein